MVPVQTEAPTTAAAPKLPLSLGSISKAAALIGLLAALYAPVLAGLIADWRNDPNLSQGLLIPPLALYIAWLRRRITLAEPVDGDRRALALVICGCGLLLAGKLGAEFFLSRISLVLVLAGLIGTFWGKRRLKTLAFPLLLLTTSIPLPVVVYNQLAAPLQLFASGCATRAAQWLGVSVYQDGNIIHLARLSLGVEEACSGLNSLSALTVTSLLLGYLCCVRFRARLTLFLASIPLSIAVNILRITGTAVIADYHEEFAMGFYHSFSGWLIFLVGFGLLYAAAQLVHRFLD